MVNVSNALFKPEFVITLSTANQLKIILKESARFHYEVGNLAGSRLSYYTNKQSCWVRLLSLISDNNSDGYFHRLVILTRATIIIER